MCGIGRSGYGSILGLSLIHIYQGAWIWKLNKSGSEIIQESRFIAKGKMEVFTIAELTQWLFGYALPEQVENVPYGQYIEPFHGVFLDEVV